ncbi:MAG: c-type cytochrome [Planctomycetota bacterium]|nr:c-type cytochrome [Planctomycetota bacterium]
MTNLRAILQGRSHLPALAAVFCLSLLVAGLAGEKDPSPPRKPENTQAETIPLLTAEQALAKLKVPEGFRASLFASDPQVFQPIAGTFDARGRLWVAENNTYAERRLNFDLNQRDRIVILEDADGDGRCDRRKVFWDKGHRLTSIELGFGGVWALCAPNLYFIPDADGDDVPDGEAQIILDGWNADEVRHNIVNGLKWGPDGWLYGRHGIQGTSVVGVPGTSSDRREKLNCSIWRYHPVTNKFEIVCRGTTNSWGSDWDDYGELFFINTVIGHLWHAVPGAHFKRMYGEDFRPHLYELLDQTADHVHWASGEPWHSAKKGLSDATSGAGGGHAHTGMMIYLGSNWPAEYRNDVFTVNFHGRRINRDHLERHGATYRGVHRKDMVESGDSWFRGIELLQGPTGEVLVLDWADIGECHENDGVHRSSGRIFRIGQGKPAKPAAIDLGKLSAAELVQLQLHEDEWFVRQARHQLQQRAAGGQPLGDTAGLLSKMLREQPDVRRKLRALWCLHVIGAADEKLLLGLLQNPDEHLRSWGVRLLVDSGEVSPSALSALEALALKDPSGLVLTYLASALQKLPLARRWKLAGSLVGREEFSSDRVLPTMIWYGIEPAVPAAPSRALACIEKSRMPKVSRYTARRLTYELDNDSRTVSRLLDLAVKASSDHRRAILSGLSQALDGWLKVEAPSSWERSRKALLELEDPETRKLVERVGIVFSGKRGLEDLRSVAGSGRFDTATRNRAIRTLAAANDEKSWPILKRLVGDNKVGPAAIRAIAGYPREDAADFLLQRVRGIHSNIRGVVIEALAERPRHARKLLEAAGKGALPPGLLTPYLIRQIQLFGDPEIDKLLRKVFPAVALIGADRLASIAKWSEELAPERLEKADPARGRKLFAETCGACHRMFGEGGTAGPELTGAQRGELGYWLENILDPSGIVPQNFRMSVVRLKDGRVLTGVLGLERGRTITLRTPKEEVLVDRSLVVEVKPTDLSLMPGGLLEQLKPEQVRDLVSYLMSPAQVKAAD